MNLIKKIIKKINFSYLRYIKRDPFLLEVERWFKAKGDETLRLNYPLTAESIVFDIGGYHGDFAADIFDRYGCTLYIFEPVPEFYQHCLNRFKGNDKIICFNYGLASNNCWLDIGLADNASSFDSPFAQKNKQKVELRSITELISGLGIKNIDLFKINIEGGEFDVIPEIIKSGDIKNIKYLQIQFHNFVNLADEQRTKIRAHLGLTHSEMWNYVFVWESWKLKDDKR